MTGVEWKDELTPEENLARFVDQLVGARARAAEASRCPNCKRPATLAVHSAEQALIDVAERIASLRPV